MSYCASTSAVKHADHTTAAVSLRCRSWGCPECAPDRRKQLIAEVLGGSPTTLLTLTIRRTFAPTPAAAAAALARAWRLCRLRLIRKRGLSKLPFFAVFEKHQSGWPHLHILLRTVYIPRQQISAIMAELIDSPVIDIRLLHDRQRAAVYVAKYSVKQPHRFATAKRYWSSRDYDIRPEHPSKTKSILPSPWAHSLDDLQQIARQLQLSHHLVVWETSWRIAAVLPAEWRAAEALRRGRARA